MKNIWGKYHINEFCFSAITAHRDKNRPVFDNRGGFRGARKLARNSGKRHCRIAPSGKISGNRYVRRNRAWASRFALWNSPARTRRKTGGGDLHSLLSQKLLFLRQSLSNNWKLNNHAIKRVNFRLDSRILTISGYLVMLSEANLQQH